MSRTLSGATHEKPRQADVKGCLKDKHHTAMPPAHHSLDAIKLKSGPGLPRPADWVPGCLPNNYLSKRFSSVRCQYDYFTLPTPLRASPVPNCKYQTCLVFTFDIPGCKWHQSHNSQWERAGWGGPDVEYLAVQSFKSTFPVFSALSLYIYNMPKGL